MKNRLFLALFAMVLAYGTTAAQKKVVNAETSTVTWKGYIRCGLIEK